MKRTLFILTGIFLSSFFSQAFAQMSPVGTWRSIDDKTGDPRSEVVITESNGVVTGKVIKILRKNAPQDAVCDKCLDERKNQKIIGMEIIRNAKKVDGKEVWEGGKILSPDEGKEYTLKLTPIEGGKKLEVKGSILFIGRTQTWIRVQ
jgi:uncharacterized protein (DUF2147 family)